MKSPILLAYAFPGDGTGRELDQHQVNETVRSEDMLSWVHLDANEPSCADWLQTNVSYLDPLIIEALLEDETRPRMIQFNQGVLIILRGVNLNEDANAEDMISIRLWVDNSRIISIRRRRLKAINDIQMKINNGSAPNTSGDFVSMLITLLFERMNPALLALNDATDEIEELILETADAKLRQSITEVRKKAILFKRYMAPQRDAINQIRYANIDWINEGHKLQLLEAHNQVVRYIEDLDAIRERAQIIMDELANIIAEKLNRNMYVLSVIAAIFLPLGFLTGLLGINVGGIPGAENEYAFLIFSALLLVIVVVQIILFKLKKWF